MLTNHLKKDDNESTTNTLLFTAHQRTCEKVMFSQVGIRYYIHWRGWECPVTGSHIPYNGVGIPDLNSSQEGDGYTSTKVVGISQG